MINNLKKYYYKRKSSKVIDDFLVNNKNKIRLINERNRKKIFIIGLNKTGTTSVENAITEFGIILGHQMIASRLMDDIISKKYNRLFKFIMTGEAFQDIPFSVPNIYRILDKEFPGSKFVLTVRDDENQWYDSITRFHGKLFSNGNIATSTDILMDKTIYYGWRLKVIKFLFGDKLYNEEIYKEVYLNHLNEVSEYFKDRQNDLLIINVNNDYDYVKLSKFLGMNPLRKSFPWKNKTSEIEARK